MKLDKTFLLDGKGYYTDSETLEMVRAGISSYEASKSTTVLQIVMYMGERHGKIRKMTKKELSKYSR